MRITDRLRAFADLMDELDAKPQGFAAAGDEHHVVISFKVTGAGNELILGVNQPHSLKIRQKRLLLVADPPRLDLDS